MPSIAGFDAQEWNVSIELSGLSISWADYRAPPKYEALHLII